MQQRAAVNLAFEKRIQEISTAKEALEKHFHKVGWLLHHHVFIVATVKQRQLQRFCNLVKPFAFCATVDYTS